MTVDKNTVVSLIYELRTATEGDTIEKVTLDRPLSFVFGQGTMLERFETNLKGMTSGDNFNFKIDAPDAYGLYNEEAVIELPKDSFKVNGSIDESLFAIDNMIPLQDNYGNRFNGRVTVVGTDVVTLDLNHPLADQDLYFNGQIVGVREATYEEVNGGGGGGGCCGGGGKSHGHDHGHEHEDEGGCCGGSSKQEHGHDDEGGCCGGGAKQTQSQMQGHGHDHNHGGGGGGCGCH